MMRQVGLLVGFVAESLLGDGCGLQFFMHLTVIALDYSNPTLLLFFQPCALLPTYDCLTPSHALPHLRL